MGDVLFLTAFFSENTYVNISTGMGFQIISKRMYGDDGAVKIVVHVLIINKHAQGAFIVIYFLSDALQ